MAKLAPVVESLDKIPEAQREFYTEQDGKYVLDTDVTSHPGTSALKSALGKERDEKKERGARVSQLEQEIADLKAKIEQKEEKGGDTKDLDKLLKKREDDLRAEFAPKLKELEDLKASNRREAKERVMRTAALKAGVMEERLEDALLSANRHFELDEKTGKLQVVDGDGDPTGQTPEEFFAKKFKEVKPWFYKGADTSGSGAEPETKGGAGKGDGLEGLSPVQRINAFRASKTRK